MHFLVGLRDASLDLNQDIRVPTGIPGLDPMIQGGLQRGDFVLLIGGLGTGKTIFSCEFVYNAALTMDEPAVFATFEEDIRSLKRNMMNFGFDLSSLEAKKKLKLLDLEALEGRVLALTFRFFLKH